MMKQTVVTCFLVVINDDINQNAEHDECIKWRVEGQYLQNKNITQTVELAESLFLELQVCQFEALERYDKSK